MNDLAPLAPKNLPEAMQFAEMLAKSSMVPRDYIGKPANILVATIHGREIGLPALQAMQSIAVINGKPGLFGDAMLAVCMGHPDFEDIQETIEGKDDERVAVCRVKRKKRSWVEFRFSVEDAKTAGLWKKTGPWTQYPERMLKFRARGFALRDCMPDALRGMVSAEELKDTYVKDEIDMGEAVRVEEENSPLPKSENELKLETLHATAIENHWALTQRTAVLDKLGVKTFDELFEKKLYNKALAIFKKPAPGTWEHFVDRFGELLANSAIETAYEGRHWNDLSKDERETCYKEAEAQKLDIDQNAALEAKETE